MSFNSTKAYELSDDGLILTNGVHVISGSSSPQGAINPSVATKYFQTDGSEWFHTGSGGINAWILNNFVTYNAESIANSTTTSTTTYANKVSLVTPSLVLGNYEIAWALKWKASNANRGIQVQIQRASTEILNHINFSANVADYPMITGAKKQSSISGVQTIDLGFRVGVGSTTITVSEAYLKITKIP